ncbi:MAG: hypothetical protein Q9M94_03845, partial [Candidatus Gracilibacteria bacterium]|nr:hypothetical protein [Candidatus Gracilibacteria bacterium]
EPIIGDYNFHIKSSTGTIISDFKGALKESSDNSEEDYKLCLDSSNTYIYCTGGAGEKETNFYKYIEIQQLKDSSGVDIENSFKINSVVYWNLKGIHKVEVPTILTDYKRL